MRHLSLLLIAIVFFSYTGSVLAASSSAAMAESPRIGGPNSDNERNENSGRGNIAAPIPTLVISKPPALPSPTQTPKNDNKKPDPTPTVAKPSPTPIPVKTTNPTNNSDTKQSNNNQSNTSNIVIPQNRDISRTVTAKVTPTPAVLGTTANKQTTSVAPKPKEKAQTKETPLEKIQNIIAPPQASEVQVKGANYYLGDERLSPAVTSILLYFALSLFLLGMLILKLPLLITGAIKVKHKLFGTPKPFTIPYMEVK
jgi:hypothetical protein